MREKGENQKSSGGNSDLKKQIAGAGVECNITKADIEGAGNIVEVSTKLNDFFK
jgi:hypothetical protein